MNPLYPMLSDRKQDGGGKEAGTGWEYEKMPARGKCTLGGIVVRIALSIKTKGPVVVSHHGVTTRPFVSQNILQLAAAARRVFVGHIIAIPELQHVRSFSAAGPDTLT